MLTTRLIQNIVLGLVAVIFFLALFWAYITGTRAAQTDAVLKNTEALTQGLKYFYNDHERYPTAVEFQDRNLMLNYFSFYPLQDIVGGPCQETYQYRSPSQKKYELSFCLPKGGKGLNSGWNQITN
jgi:hypothetical protein